MVFERSFIIFLLFQQWVDAQIKDLQYLQFLSFVPKILLAIIIPIFDDLYHKVAVWLNDMGKRKIKFETCLSRSRKKSEKEIFSPVCNLVFRKL